MSPEALIGMELGNSVIQRLSGQGTMGAVYLATRADRQVALKVFFSASPLAETAHEEFLHRLEEIIARNASLNHPHILGILHHGRQEQLVYQVTPYIEGESLEKLFARAQALPFAQIQRYLEQLTSALEYAHARGIIHGDVKASNILLTPAGDLLLSDFSLAGLTFEKLFSSTRQPVAGMLNALAPEYVLNQTVDQRADVYELGAVLYQMVTGAPPFPGAALSEVALQHVKKTPRPPTELRADLPPAAEQAMLRALAKKPAERFAQVRELATAFNLALASLPPATHESTAMPALNTLTNLADSAPRLGGLFDPKWRSRASQPLAAASSLPAGQNAMSNPTPTASTLPAGQSATSSPTPAASSLPAGQNAMSNPTPTASSRVLSNPALQPVDEQPTHPLPLVQPGQNGGSDPSQLSTLTFPPGFGTATEQAPQPSTFTFPPGFGNGQPQMTFQPSQALFEGGQGQTGAHAPMLAQGPDAALDFSSAAIEPGSINIASLFSTLDQLSPRGQASADLEQNNGTLQLANALPASNTDHLGDFASQQVPANTSGLLGITGQFPPHNDGSATGALKFGESVKLAQAPFPGQSGQLMVTNLSISPAEQFTHKQTRRGGTRMKVVSMILAVIIVAACSGVFLALRSNRGLASTSAPPRVRATPDLQASATARASATAGANIILADPLDQNTNQWPTGSQGWYTCAFTNHVYTITNHDKAKSAPVLLPGRTVSGPFTYTLTMEQMKGDQNAPNNLFGMMLYATVQNIPGKAQVDKFYAFEVLNGPGGQYQFWKYDNSKKASSPWTELWNKHFGKEFKQGSGQTHSNTVKIAATGRMFTFIVNGKQVGTWKDHSFSNGGVGMLVNLNGAEVAFSNLLLTYS